VSSAPPVVSTIIPFFNDAKWIADAIESCRNQEGVQAQIIVVNDGSTPSQAKSLTRFDKATLRLNQPNLGPSAARNAGLALATGEYIQFLDADDFIFSGKHQSQIRALENAGADAVYGDWIEVFHAWGKRLEGPPQVRQLTQDLVEALLNRWWVPQHSILYKASFIRSQPWPSHLKIQDDYYYNTANALFGMKLVHSPGLVCAYRRHSTSRLSQQFFYSHTAKKRWLQSNLDVFERIQLDPQHGPRLQKQLANRYLWLAFQADITFPSLSDLCFEKACALDRDLIGRYPPDRGRLFHLIKATLGTKAAHLMLRSKQTMQRSKNRIKAITGIK